MHGAGGNFCSGGDVHEIIGPLTKMDASGPARVHHDDRRPGAGDARLPAADHRRGRRRLRRARARSSPWPATCASRRPMRRPPSCSPASACRAPTWAPAPSCRGSSATAAPPSCSSPGERWKPRKGSPGASATASSEDVLAEAQALAHQLARGPSFAHAMTKRQLDAEWHVPIDEAIDMEAEAQACAWRPTISAAPTRPSRRSGSRSSRAIETLSYSL